MINIESHLNTESSIAVTDDMKPRFKRTKVSRVKSVQLTHKEEIEVYHRMYDVLQNSYSSLRRTNEFTKPEDPQKSCEHNSARRVNRAHSEFIECPTCNAHSRRLK